MRHEMSRSRFCRSTRTRTAVVATWVAFTLAGCGGADTIPPAAATAPGISMTEAPRLSPSAEPSPKPTPYPHTQIDVAGGGPVIAAGSVWLTGDASVIRLDMATDEVLATIDVGGRPHGLVADGSDVWVTVGVCASDDPASCDDGSIARIDATTNDVVETVPIGTWGYAVAVHEDTIWVSSFEDDLVVRVDRQQQRVVTEIPVTDPTGIVAGPDGVWTPLHYTGLVARIDPATNEVAMIDTGTAATEFIALTEDAVWVTAGDRSFEVVVLGRDSDEVLARIAAAWPQGIVVHEGMVWVAASGTADFPVAYDAAVVAIDAETMEVVAEYPLPNLHPDALATNGDTVWVNCEGQEGGLCMLDVGS